MTFFNILIGSELQRKFPHCPRTVPWSAVQAHERQAIRNHSQSLAKLHSRGGLSPWELYAVVHGKTWREMEQMTKLTDSECVDFLLSLNSQTPENA